MSAAIRRSRREHARSRCSSCLQGHGRRRAHAACLTSLLRGRCFRHCCPFARLSLSLGAAFHGLDRWCKAKAAPALSMLSQQRATCVCFTAQSSRWLASASTRSCQPFTGLRSAAARCLATHASQTDDLAPRLQRRNRKSSKKQAGHNNPALHAASSLEPFAPTSALRFASNNCSKSLNCAPMNQMILDLNSSSPN